MQFWNAGQHMLVTKTLIAINLVVYLADKTPLLQGVDQWLEMLEYFAQNTLIVIVLKVAVVE